MTGEQGAQVSEARLREIDDAWCTAQRFAVTALPAGMSAREEVSACAPHRVGAVLDPDDPDVVQIISGHDVLLRISRAEFRAFARWRS